MTNRAMVNDIAADAAVGAVKITPPATVIGLSAMGVQIDFAVKVMTAIYVFGLCVSMGWKAFKWYRRQGWTER